MSEEMILMFLQIERAAERRLIERRTIEQTGDSEYAADKREIERRQTVRRA